MIHTAELAKAIAQAEKKREKKSVMVAKIMRSINDAEGQIAQLVKQDQAEAYRAIELLKVNDDLRQRNAALNKELMDERSRANRLEVELSKKMNEYQDMIVRLNKEKESPIFWIAAEEAHNERRPTKQQRREESEERMIAMSTVLSFGSTRMTQEAVQTDRENEPEKMRKVYCNSIVNTLADQVRRNGREMRPVLATSFYSPKSGLKHRFSMVLRGKTRKVIGVLILAGMLTVVSGFVLGEKSGKEASGVGSKIHQVDVIESSEEYETNTEWSEQEVEETTYYEEYTTWVEDDDQVASSAYAEASDYEPSVSESVMWTGEMETSDETQVAETFISEQYEVMPSIG